MVRRLRGQYYKSLGLASWRRHRWTRTCGMGHNSIFSQIQTRCATTSPDFFLGAINIDETRTYVRVRVNWATSRRDTMG